MARGAAGLHRDGRMRRGDCGVFCGREGTPRIFAHFELSSRKPREALAQPHRWKTASGASKRLSPPRSRRGARDPSHHKGSEAGMRVLLVTDWNSNAGGAESYIMTLRDSLRAGGDEVRLLACGAELDQELRPHEKIRGSDRASAQAFLQIVNPFAVTRVRSVAREFRPDVAFVSHFAYHLSPAALSGLRNVPTVVGVMDYKCICPLGTKLLPDNALCAVRAGVVCQRNGCVSTPHWLRDRPRYAMIRSALSRVDRVVSPSRWIQNELETAGVHAEHVPLGVRPAGSRFRRTPATKPLFVYCGRLSREKGVSLLIRAFARTLYAVPDAHLRIVGDGPERPDLED